MSEPAIPVNITPGQGERRNLPMRLRPEPFSVKPAPAAMSPPDPREAALATIRRLHRRANHGLYVLAAFLLLSFAALDDFSFLPSFSPAFRDALGVGPSPGFISMALVVYLFSAVIMALARMMDGAGKTGGIAHLGYLGAFYCFFHLSGALADNLWAVIGSGITILCLEAYQLWNHCQEEIRRTEETLNQRNRLLAETDDTPT